jgi:DNA-binding beta-propeller fold protein YncE
MGFNRISRFYVNMYLGKGFKMDDPQGLCGAKMVEEDDPKTGNDDHILTMFGVNSGTGQIVYNVKLIEPRIFGRRGSGDGEFSRPHGICCNSRGDVYVADTDNDRVVRLLYSGGTLTWISSINGLKRPYDVAVGSYGRVYVADSGNNRVAVFDSLGNLRASWGAGLEGPTALCELDRNSEWNEYGYEGLVVIDRGRTRVNQLSSSGEVVRQVDMRRIGLDEAAFAYCAFDLHGNVYVTDQLNSQLHMFDANLKYIVSFGRQGAEGSAFDSPRGIAIWRRFGQVFVSEREGGQYYWLGLDAYLLGFFPPEFNSARPGTTVALYITEMADIKVDITDGSGKLIRSLVPEHLQRPGEVLIVWDGKDNKGRLVEVGDYNVAVTARPTYSRPRYILKKELAGTVKRIAD